MQEEVEQRVVTLVVDCAKLTEQELRKYSKEFLINYYNEKKRQNWYEISARVCEEEKDFDIPDPFVDVTREYASKETLDRVLRIVEAMGEEYVQTLYFKYVYHYTDQHSATMLGVSVSNFRVRLTRIRKRLKMHFGKEIQI